MSIDPVFCASAQTFLWLVYKGQPMSGFNSTTQVETRQVIPSPYLCSWFCIHYHRSSPEYLPRGYALFLGTPLGNKVLWFPLFFCLFTKRRRPTQQLAVVQRWPSSSLGRPQEQLHSRARCWRASVHLACTNSSAMVSGFKTTAGNVESESLKVKQKCKRKEKSKCPNSYKIGQSTCRKIKMK